MKKIDLVKTEKVYYSAQIIPEAIDLKETPYVSILGKGDPSQAEFAERVKALYATAYALKFLYKSQQKDFVVSKLEGLWWYDESRFPNVSISEASTTIPRSEWEYRLLIRLPDFVKAEEVTEMAAHAAGKKKIILAREVVYFKLNEGKVVQILHVGPFDKESESLLKLFEFIQTQGFQRNGFHHEIYLSDFRKTAPDKLKTILREPVK